MLTELLETLTADQKRELRSLGVPDTVRSDWKAGRRRPSLAEAAILEEMLRLPPHRLRDWLTIEKANPVQREWLEKAKGKVKKHATAVSVLPFVTYTAIAGALPAWLDGLKSATMYRRWPRYSESR